MANDPGYWLRGLAVDIASTHQAENPRGFSEVSENKLLLIAIFGISIYLSIFSKSTINRSVPMADFVF